MASALVALLVGELVGAPLLLGASAQVPLGDELSILQKGPRVWRPGAEVDTSAQPATMAHAVEADFVSHRHVQVPSLVVDLDVEPEKRWRNVTRYYMGLGVFPDCCTLGSTPEVKPLMYMFNSIALPQDYRRELEGIVADVNDPRLTVEDLLLMNFGYELKGFGEGSPADLMKRIGKAISDGAAKSRKELLRILASAPKVAGGRDAGPSSGCSGLLAAMPDGTVVHGRNLDYANMTIEVNGTTLRYPEISVEVTFMKGGKPFIVSTQWPGLTGFMTAMRIGGWSFQQNTRLHNMATNLPLGGFHHFQGFMYRVREIMETTPDFQTAVQKIYDSNFIAPQYFVIAGAKPFEGAVVTVERGGEHRSPGSGVPPPLRLSSTPAGASGSTWYLLQTNDDHWQKAEDYRRPSEMQRLVGLQPGNVSAEWMMREMMAPALYNSYTAFTTVFVPATGYHSTLAHLGNSC